MAIYQGRSSDNKWKKDARLNAYAGFIESVFEFDQAIAGLDSSPFGDADWDRVAEAVDRVALARASIVVVGPDSVFEQAAAVMDRCVKALDYLRDLDGSGVSRVVENFEEREQFTRSLHDFAVETQKVLGTTRLTFSEIPRKSREITRGSRETPANWRDPR